METRELRALGWSAADGERIAASPVTVRWFEYEDLPISVTARWVEGHPFGDETLAWRGSSSWPFPLADVLFKSTRIDRAEFDELRRLEAEVSSFAA
jgi:hypothetical protein